MAENNNTFSTVIKSLVDGAGGAVSSKTVVGEPVRVGDTTIIPLSDVNPSVPTKASRTLKSRIVRSATGPTSDSEP